MLSLLPLIFLSSCRGFLLMGEQQCCSIVECVVVWDPVGGIAYGRILGMVMWIFGVVVGGR